MIDHNSMTPLYQQVSNQILSDVASGEFSVNKRLPTEKEMSEQYGVSRITVRRAVSDLGCARRACQASGKGDVSEDRAHAEGSEAGGPQLY